jgi:hypothetical protein
MGSTPSHLRFLVNQDGAVILDIPANLMTTLNASGAYIWTKLQEGKALSDIVDDLVHQTDQPLSVVERDVQEFLEQLAERHLLNL